MGRRFFIYGLLGWIAEILWTGAGSALRGDWVLAGNTYLWMFPIYGLAVLLEPLHERIRGLPWPVRGLVWLAGIWGIELATGWGLKQLIGRCPWDYSRVSPYTLGGFIRFDYAPVWFAAGLLFERLHDRLRSGRR